MLYSGLNQQGSTGRMKYSSGIYFLKEHIWPLIEKMMIQIGVYINVEE